MAGLAWLERRDPGLATTHQAIRVAAAACISFYIPRYVLGDGVLATYGLFSAFALGFLSQVSGSAARRALTLAVSVVVGAGLITLASLVAGNLAVATVSIVVFGFLIAFAGVGGPRLVGIAAGMQLLFILPNFPPYALDSLPSRLLGLVFGVGLLIVANLVLWPNPASVSGEERLAAAADALSNMLFIRAANDLGARPAAEDAEGTPPPGAAATFAAAEEAANAIRPSRLPPDARPASASRTDRALGHASALLRYALARLGQLPDQPAPPPAAAHLLACAARSARESAIALRGGPVATTTELAAAFAAARDQRHRAADQPALPSGYATNLALVIGDAVWAMTTAIRVARGAPIEPGHGSVAANEERFPYAHLSTARLWWRRFAVNLTPRSIYFQAAVRVALALGVARVVAGVLDLEHGFWVLLATLTLLRSRAVDTRVALRPAIIGTVGGAVVAALLLLVIGENNNVYAALLPPIIVVALASTIFGIAWAQASFTLAITLVFSQLTAASVTLAGVRLTDVLLGAVIGTGAGLLAWPRGADGELHRSAARFLARCGDLVRHTAHQLTTPSPSDASAGHAPKNAAGDVPRDAPRDAPSDAPADAHDETAPASSDRQRDEATATGRRIAMEVKEAMVLADSSYQMYQAERHSPGESMVDWQAVLAAGHHIVRGSELLRDATVPGSLAPWRTAVERSASRVADACEEVADALNRGRRPSPPTMDLPDPSDDPVIDVQAWFVGIREDLGRIGRSPTHTDVSAP